MAVGRGLPVPLKEGERAGGRREETKPWCVVALPIVSPKGTRSSRGTGTLSCRPPPVPKPAVIETEKRPRIEEAVESNK